MKSFFAIAAGLLAASASVFAAPGPSNPGYISKYSLPANHSGDVKEYIITFWRNETIPRPVDEYLDALSLNRNESLVYESECEDPKIFIVKMCDEHAKIFQGMTEVNIVEEKAEVKSFAEQQGAPWGLQRVSSAAGAKGSPQDQDFVYSFDDSALGAGVDIYVIDTGVRTSHAVFTGRASEGFTATGSSLTVMVTALTLPVPPVALSSVLLKAPTSSKSRFLETTALVHLPTPSRVWIGSSPTTRSAVHSQASSVLS